METIRKSISIRLSLFLSTGIAIIMAQLLHMAAMSLIDGAMMSCMNPRPDTFVYKEGTLVAINFGSMPAAGIEITSPEFYETLKTLRLLSPVLIYGLCLTLAILLFYRFKLQQPLKELNMGITRIACQDLDFHLTPCSGDELGRLCTAFEEMRGELTSAFQALWKSEENQRSIYRSFAHDLRTPLTIIKGNNDIIEAIAAPDHDWNRVLEAVAVSSSAVTRIETYAEQIRVLEHADDWSLSKKTVRLTPFTDEYRLQTELLAVSRQRYVLVICAQDAEVLIDDSMLLRILDNLVGNGVEYAAAGIILTFRCSDSSLVITCADDGPGFTDEAIKQAVNPFYTTNKAGGHMGIGLTIVQKLTEKMEGSLTIENKKTGGCVTISIPI